MSEFIDFTQLKRPPKPNTCLAAPTGLCEKAEPDIQIPTFNLTADALFASLTDLIHSERQWGRLVTDKTSGRLRFVAVTSLMRFKDDIDMQILPVSPTTSDLAIYSRSRIGHSDFGANRKRVEKLVAALTRN